MCINRRDFIYLADKLGIVKDIVAVYEFTRYVERLPRGGQRRIKIDDKVNEFLVAQVGEKPTVIL